MNFFNQGIPLGRWFGITVVLHWTFLIFAAFEVFQSNDAAASIIFMVLLFGTVLVHEFGHALSCKAVGGSAVHIVLWPLGGIAFVQPPMNPWAWLVTTVCGPLVNAILWPVFWWACVYGLPMWAGHLSPTMFDYVQFICVEMWHINELLLLFNLIPGYPMDGGRLLQEILWLIVGYPQSLQIAGMVGTVCGASFVVLGLGLVGLRIPIIEYPLGTKGSPDMMLIIIGILVVSQSFGIYKRSQEIRGWRKN